jgi:hypothetical protein
MIMTMFSCLKKLLGKRRPASVGRVARSNPAGRVRPGVEMLEDRLVPTFVPFGTNALFVLADKPTDTFNFTAVPGNKPLVSLNGLSYNLSGTAIDQIYFVGQAGGQNVATIADTTGFAGTTLDLTGDHGTLTGANYLLSLSNMPTIVATGAANAQATLHGTIGNQNSYVAYANGGLAAPFGAVMTNEMGAVPPTPYYDKVIGFANISGYAGTLLDSATYSGSATLTTTFASSPTVSQMLSGTAFDIQGSGFRWVKAYGNSGWDTARLYGSASYVNTFVGTAVPNTSTEDDVLYSSAHSDEVVGFHAVLAYAGAYQGAGTPEDVAYLYGAKTTTTPNDFIAMENGGNVGGTTLGAILTTRLSETDPPNTIYDSVSGFQHIYGYAGTSADIADFRGSANYQSTFVSSPALSQMSASTIFYAQASGFRWVGAVAGSVADTASLTGATTCQNTYVGGKVDALGRVDDHLTSIVHSDEVDGFGQVTVHQAYATDVAYLYGSTMYDNSFYGNYMYSNDSWMINAVHAEEVVGFAQVYAIAGRATDTADLWGSNPTPGNPSSVNGPNYWVEAFDFDPAKVHFH